MLSFFVLIIPTKKHFTNWRLGTSIFTQKANITLKIFISRSIFPNFYTANKRIFQSGGLCWTDITSHQVLLDKQDWNCKNNNIKDITVSSIGYVRNQPSFNTYSLYPKSLECPVNTLSLIQFPVFLSQGRVVATVKTFEPNISHSKHFVFSCCLFIAHLASKGLHVKVCTSTKGQTYALEPCLKTYLNHCDRPFYHSYSSAAEPLPS